MLHKHWCKGCGARLEAKDGGWCQAPVCRAGREVAMAKIAATEARVRLDGVVHEHAWTRGNLLAEIDHLLKPPSHVAKRCGYQLTPLRCKVRELPYEQVPERLIREFYSIVHPGAEVSIDSVRFNALAHPGGDPHVDAQLRAVFAPKPPPRSEVALLEKRVGLYQPAPVSERELSAYELSAKLSKTPRDELLKVSVADLEKAFMLNFSAFSGRSPRFRFMQAIFEKLGAPEVDITGGDTPFLQQTWAYENLCKSGCVTREDVDQLSGAFLDAMARSFGLSYRAPWSGPRLTDDDMRRRVRTHLKRPAKDVAHVTEETNPHTRPRGTPAHKGDLDCAVGHFLDRMRRQFQVWAIPTTPGTPADAMKHLELLRPSYLTQKQFLDELCKAAGGED